MPCALISEMIVKIWATSLGARPIEGSSRSSSFGLRHERSADGEHLLLAAGQRAPRLLAPLGETREQLEDALELLVANPRSRRA